MVGSVGHWKKIRLKWNNRKLQKTYLLCNQKRRKAKHSRLFFLILLLTTKSKALSLFLHQYESGLLWL